MNHRQYDSRIHALNYSWVLVSSVPEKDESEKVGLKFNIQKTECWRQGWYSLFQPRPWSHVVGTVSIPGCWCNASVLAAHSVYNQWWPCTSHRWRNKSLIEVWIMEHLHGLKYVTVWDQLAGNWALSDDHFGKGSVPLTQAFCLFPSTGRAVSNSTWECSFSRWFCKVPRNGEPLVFREGPQREAAGVENEHQTPRAIGKPGICSLLCISWCCDIEQVS